MWDVWFGMFSFVIVWLWSCVVWFWILDALVAFESVEVCKALLEPLLVSKSAEICRFIVFG
jgi:hypothetical protein